MSDDEDYYDDDDDYYYWEEDPIDGVAGLADDLCEHTMHSPVWLDTADNLADNWSDWEYYSDDYYDQERPKRPVRPESTTAGEKLTPGLKRKRVEDDKTSKRRKLNTIEIENSALADEARPVVRWRPTEDPEIIPKLYQEGSERVALLQDWRERFPAAERSSSVGESGKQSVKSATLPAKKLPSRRKEGRSVVDLAPSDTAPAYLATTRSSRSRGINAPAKASNSLAPADSNSAPRKRKDWEAERDVEQHDSRGGKRAKKENLKSQIKPAKESKVESIGPQNATSTARSRRQK
ncbi:MAG: hypothetical protein M1825_001279 [Sarcosagium campestre]|nr:MAG: hypothetical protein M1825_001279 [Sarcosagium campestre]